jgi:hypothetical protein
MPKLTAKYRGLEGIDLDQFPSEVTLKHGKDGEREWWEWTNGKRGKNRQDIIIQRPNQKLSWVIFFDQGERVRTLEVPVPEQDKARGVIAITFGTFNLDEAIKALADLGITAYLERLPAKRGEKPFQEFLGKET